MQRHQGGSSEILLDSCDRTRSKEARASLDRILWRPLAHVATDFPKECPLAPLSDVLWAQENIKQPIAARHWRCGLCGKSFRSEHFLDRHLARRHGTHQQPHGDVAESCFAAFCGVVVPCLPLTDLPLPAVSSEVLRSKDAPSSDDSGVATRGSKGAHLPSQLPSPFGLGEVQCGNASATLSNKQVCFQLVDKCITSDIFKAEGELVAQRVRLHRSLCDDAVHVECASRAEKIAWSSELALDAHIPTRHIVGWMLFAIAVGMFVLGRCFAVLRGGEQHFRYRRGQKARLDRVTRRGFRVRRRE